MGARGARILGFFGSLFAAQTMYWQWHMSGFILAAPLVGLAAIWVATSFVIRQPGRGVVPTPRAGRAIKWSTIGEGAGLCIVGNVALLTGRTDLLLPGMSLVVGLHFLPIARAASFRAFYALGAALILFAVLGFCVRAPLGGEISGFMAAICLWTAAVLAIRRDLAARRNTATA